MDNQVIASIQFLQRQAASLLLYQSVLTGEVGQAFLNLLQALRHSDGEGLGCLQVYGRWFNALSARNQSWQDYLITQILTDGNPFTILVQQADLAKLPPSLVAAVKQDLQALQSLYKCSSDTLSQWVQAASDLPVAPVAWNYEPAAVQILDESLV